MIRKVKTASERKRERVNRKNSANEYKTVKQSADIECVCESERDTLCVAVSKKKITYIDTERGQRELYIHKGERIFISLLVCFFWLFLLLLVSLAYLFVNVSYMQRKKERIRRQKEDTKH